MVNVSLFLKLFKTRFLIYYSYKLFCSNYLKLMFKRYAQYIKLLKWIEQDLKVELGGTMMNVSIIRGFHRYLL